MLTKSGLSIALSKLKQFDNPKLIYEQYSTEPEIAAQILWFAFMQGDIKSKTIADLGCGPGIFGIGATLLGAKEVYFVDKDEYAIKTTLQNIKKTTINSHLIQSNIKEFKKKVDVVLQNPPFGTKIKHHDKLFLEKAFQVSSVVYSLHKITSKGFIEAIAKDYNFQITHMLPFNMYLKRTMKFHKKPKYLVKVACWRLSKTFK